MKDTVPNDGTDFTFTSGTLPGAPFNLDDDADGTLPNSKTHSNLTPGTYDVAETANPNYATVGTCDDQSPIGAISLQPGETVTCTFTNTFQLKESRTMTQVHNVSHQNITGTSVPAGTAVHDQATVSGDGVTAPTGNVNFSFYTNGQCTGPTIDTELVALSLVGFNGVAESVVKPSLAVGQYGYKASYAGDGNYLPSEEQACEPFAVVDARITISATDTNEVNNNHTFTVFVEKNDGTGWTPASGVTINSTESGVGAITGGTCGPSGPTDGAGQCTVIVSSSSAGVSTVQASGTVSIGAANVDVATNGHGAHNISNQKTWVDANITISPDGINPVNAPHTFTVTVMKDLGAGMVAAAGEDVNFVLTDGGGAVAVVDTVLSTCDNPGANTNASGQCTIVFTSATAGTTVGNATVSLIVGSVSLTRDTDPLTVPTSGPGGSGPATKTWEQPALEGCTPGYWKQSQHFDSWVVYATGNDFDTVFGRNAFTPNKTLLQVLSQGGGGLKALARHAVAALLNSANPDVDYAYDSATVISMFQAAFDSGDYETAKNLFETNNELGCPLN